MIVKGITQSTVAGFASTLRLQRDSDHIVASIDNYVWALGGVAQTYGYSSTSTWHRQQREHDLGVPSGGDALAATQNGELWPIDSRGYVSGRVRAATAGIR